VVMLINTKLKDAQHKIRKDAKKPMKGGIKTTPLM